jgi:hypothetical protein
VRLLGRRSGRSSGIRHRGSGGVAGGSSSVTGSSGGVASGSGSVRGGFASGSSGIGSGVNGRSSGFSSGVHGSFRSSDFLLGAGRQRECRNGGSKSELRLHLMITPKRDASEWNQTT